MPFVSKAQQKFMFAKHPRMAKEWAHHTPNIKALPEHVHKKKAEDQTPLVQAFLSRCQQQGLSNLQVEQAIKTACTMYPEIADEFEDGGLIKASFSWGGALGGGMLGSSLGIPGAIGGALLGGAVAPHLPEGVKSFGRGGMRVGGAIGGTVGGGILGSGINPGVGSAIGAGVGGVAGEEGGKHMGNLIFGEPTGEAKLPGDKAAKTAGFTHRLLGSTAGGAIGGGIVGGLADSKHKHKGALRGALIGGGMGAGAAAGHHGAEKAIQHSRVMPARLIKDTKRFAALTGGVAGGAAGHAVGGDLAKKAGIGSMGKYLLGRALPYAQKILPKSMTGSPGTLGNSLKTWGSALRRPHLESQLLNSAAGSEERALMSTLAGRGYQPEHAKAMAAETIAKARQGLTSTSGLSEAVGQHSRDLNSSLTAAGERAGHAPTATYNTYRTGATPPVAESGFVRKTLADTASAAVPMALLTGGMMMLPGGGGGESPHQSGGLQPQASSGRDGFVDRLLAGMGVEHRRPFGKEAIAPWEVLGIPEGASAEAVQKAWRALARQHHPDRGGSKAMQELINAAKDDLLGKGQAAIGRFPNWSMSGKEFQGIGGSLAPGVTGTTRKPPSPSFGGGGGFGRGGGGFGGGGFGSGPMDPGAFDDMINAFRYPTLPGEAIAVNSVQGGIGGAGLGAAIYKRRGKPTAQGAVAGAGAGVGSFLAPQLLWNRMAGHLRAGRKSLLLPKGRATHPAIALAALAGSGLLGGAAGGAAGHFGYAGVQKLRKPEGPLQRLYSSAKKRLKAASILDDVGQHWQGLSPQHKTMAIGGSSAALLALLNQLSGSEHPGINAGVGAAGLGTAAYGLSGGDPAGAFRKMTGQVGSIGRAAGGLASNPAFKQYLDTSGNPNFQALVRASDAQLKPLAKALSPAERAKFQQQIKGYVPSFGQRLGAKTMGIDVDAQKARFGKLLGG